jgi:glutamate racemase
LVEAHAAGVRVVTQPAPGLVERVEAGELSTAATRTLVEQYVKPLVERGADTIVLGCTHYPFLSNVIQDVAGSRVTVIDPAVAVARELRRRLQAGGLLAPDGRAGGERFWTTGPPEQVQAVIAQLWGKPIEMSRVAAA